MLEQKKEQKKERKRGLKRVVKCSGCPNLVRKTRAYKVYFNGKKSDWHVTPPVEVTDELMYLCPSCYEKAGYHIRPKQPKKAKAKKIKATQEAEEQEKEPTQILANGETLLEKKEEEGDLTNAIPK